MNSIFSYDSKPMQMLMFLGDLIILNFLFLVCCIPIFTIGAAQAGLYNAVKVLLDKEDDNSPAAAFFRGFSSGFGTVTLSWGLMTVLLLVVVYLGLTAIAMGSPIWLAVLPMILVALFQTLIPAFHSRFGCTAMQLIRNVFLLLFAHPIRSIGAVVILWVPAVVFLLDLFVFMQITPIWLTLYFSTAAAFGFSFLKKPFNTLTDHFNESHATEAPTLDQSEEDEAFTDEEYGEAYIDAEDEDAQTVSPAE